MKFVSEYLSLIICDGFLNEFEINNFFSCQRRILRKDF